MPPIRDLSVLILTRDEAENLPVILPLLGEVLGAAGVTYEVVVVDARSADGTAAVAARLGARVLLQAEPGYASALREGLRACTRPFILALDADLSHRPEFVAAMLTAGADADLVIASRYVAGGSAEMDPLRWFLSRVMNGVFGTVLGVPIRDLSSGFRLYRRAALEGILPQGRHFDVLPELAAAAHARGLTIREIPFDYRPREAGVSKARVLQFLPSYLGTLWRCFRARPRPAQASDAGRLSGV